MSRHTQPLSKSEGFPDKKLRNGVISKFQKNLRRDTWTYYKHYDALSIDNIEIIVILERECLYAQY